MDWQVSPMALYTLSESSFTLDRMGIVEPWVIFQTTIYPQTTPLKIVDF